MRALWLLPLLAALGCGTARLPSLPAKASAPSPTPTQDDRFTLLKRDPGGVDPQLVVGASFACGLHSSGRIQCWGSGPSGQLGDGKAYSLPRPPVEVPLDRARQIAAGAAHACALLDHGEVFCWGSNERGQLGLEDRRPAPHHPVRLVLPVAIKSLADNPLCAVSEDDDVYCWGEAAPASLQNNQRIARITSLPPIRSVSVTEKRTCAVSFEAEVLCWSGSDVSKVPLPGLLTQVSARADSGCALGTQGQAFCWGHLPRTQDATPSPPTLIRGLTEAIRVRVGNGLGCALRKEGTIACWGDLLRGGPWSWDLDRIAPSGSEATEVPGVAGAVDLAVGDGFSCALRRDGSVMCWGSNEHGIVSSGKNEPVVLAPRVVPGVDLR